MCTIWCCTPLCNARDSETRGLVLSNVTKSCSKEPGKKIGEEGRREEEAREGGEERESGEERKRRGEGKRESISLP